MGFGFCFFGVWSSEFGILILWFLAWDLEFGNFGLEFSILGFWDWDSVLGFVVWSLGFGIFEFGIFIL